MQKIINFLKKHKRKFYVFLFEIEMLLNIYLIYIFWENNILKYVFITTFITSLIIGIFLNYIHKKNIK
jgi:hypothetical protein